MLRLIIAAPFLLVVVLFALSNRQPTVFTLWPTDYALTLPLSIAVLIAMAVAFVAGALVLWMSALAARRRARRAEHTARLLEAQVAELKARLAATRTSPAAQSGALVPAGR
jgi:putative membrane protein